MVHLLSNTDIEHAFEVPKRNLAVTAFQSHPLQLKEGDRNAEKFEISDENLCQKPGADQENENMISKSASNKNS